jgi:DNA-binding transcriptional LysR family regulator
MVSRLERHLGVRLLQRTTRALALTEIGREVLNRAVAILAASDELVQVAHKTRDKPAGTLRLTCGVEFGLLAVSHWIGAYLRRHENVRIEADFTNRVVDIVHEGFDLAIRVGSLDDSSLVSRRLGDIAYGLFAAPQYLNKRGVPRAPKDLARHDLILSSQTKKGRGSWQLTSARERRVIVAEPRLLVNTHLAARDFAVAGFGITLLPVFQATPFVEAGSLLRVLPGWSRDSAPVYVLFPSNRFLVSKVRAFIDEATVEFAKLAACTRA